jgi:hypothetical protein
VALPPLLDRELHALSVRLTRRLEADAAAATTGLCAELTGDVPEREVLASVFSAVRDAVESEEDTRPPRVLLVTTTAGLAAVTGQAAVDILAVLRPSTMPQPLLAPIGVAVNPSCYDLWRRRDPTGSARCHSWLERALRAVSTGVHDDLNQRYDELRQALGVIAADAVDHGVLLI